LREFPASERPASTTFEARQAIHRVLHGADDRLLVVVGPCSIHDYDAAIDYATRLAAIKSELAESLIVVMRVYFEKPRTTVGWKGLINDPRLDDSFRINEGLRLARRILLEINELDLPAGTEYLDMITPQYIADLIAWGAIGARTTESQVHRQLASGLSCPVGFKNGTNGDVRIAVDAIKAASAPHHFLSVTKGRPLGHRAHGRQRGLPHHPARRQVDQLRRGERRRDVQRTRACRTRRARDDRLFAREQPEAATSGRSTSRAMSPARWQEATRASSASMIESHLNAGGRTSCRKAAGIWCVDHRRLHRLGCDGRSAARTGRGRSRAAARPDRFGVKARGAVPRYRSCRWKRN
jgi:hypothetical protein